MNFCILLAPATIDDEETAESLRQLQRDYTGTYRIVHLIVPTLFKFLEKLRVATKAVESPILDILHECMSEATRVVDAKDSKQDLAKRFNVGSRDFAKIFADLVKPADWSLVDKLEFLENLSKDVAKLRLTEPKSWAKYLFLWLCLDQDSHSCTVKQFKSRLMSGSVGWYRNGRYYAVHIKTALQDRHTFGHRLVALVGRLILRLEFSELQVPFDEELWSNNGQVSVSLDLKALSKSFAARVNGLKEAEAKAAKQDQRNQSKKKRQARKKAIPRKKTKPSTRVNIYF